MSDSSPVSSPDTGPQRTCIATRTVRPAASLLRCVVERDVPGGESGALRIVPDPGRRLPGRGAWITATVDAYETAVQRRAFARALKVPPETDTSQVREFLGNIRTGGALTYRGVPHLTTSPVAEKEKETDY